MKLLKKILLAFGAFISFALIAIIILFIAYEGLLFYKYDFNPDYALIDRCLDLGDEWDYNKDICLDQTSDITTDENQ